MTIADTSRKLNIKYSTVQAVIVKIKRLGTEGLKMHWIGPRRKPIGSEDIEKLLLSEEILKKWGGKTIRERREKIRIRFGVTVGKWRLEQFYRMHKIKFRRTYECFRGEVIDPVGL